MNVTNLTRRTVFAVLGAGVLRSICPSWAADEPTLRVYRDPDCGCCTGWILHIQAAGFATSITETADLGAVKARLGIPNDLAACHTAEVAGYVLEGHVPAAAVKRLLVEKPAARGLAVPGMPGGSPGMGGPAETYEVVLFGAGGRRSYMRFHGDREI